MCIASVLVFVLNDSVDFSDYDTRKFILGITAVSVIMLLSVIAGLLTSLRSPSDGSSLILPFQENTKRLWDRSLIGK